MFSTKTIFQEIRFTKDIKKEKNYWCSQNVTTKESIDRSKKK